jgi:hypothetical protein
MADLTVKELAVGWFYLLRCALAIPFILLEFVGLYGRKTLLSWWQPK